MFLFILLYKKINDLFISDFSNDGASLLSDNYEEGWYYLQIMRSSYLKDLNLSLKSYNYVTKRWICGYLDSEMVNKISSNSSFKIIPAKEKIPSQLLSVSEDNNYLLESNEKFVPKDSIRFYGNFYVTKSLDDFDDRRIRSVTYLPKIDLSNRWTKGVVQSETFKLVIENQNRLIPFQPFYEKGIRGQNEIVSIIDSGIDHRHCFFFDPDHDVPYNRTDFKHRKIVRYQAEADTFDSERGHGSHVSGIIAGNSLCKNCSGSLYNGIAPEAKLFFVDAGKYTEPQSLIPNYSFEDMLKIAISLNSSIFSNSWGFPPDTLKVRPLFDRICYDHPSVAFFFGAGNQRAEYQIFTPADSKNAIGVGNIAIPHLRKLDKGYSPIIKLDIQRGNRSFQKKISNVNFSKSFLLHITDQRYLLGLQNKKVVSYNENIKNYEGNFIYFDKLFRGCLDLELLPSKNCSGVFMNEDSLTNLIEFCGQSQKIPIFHISHIEINDTISFIFDYTYHGLNDFYAVINSYGPTRLGLLKPDILAPGDNIFSAKSNGKSPMSPECTLNGLVSKSGTSMATPSAAGAGVLIVQYFKDGYYPSCVKTMNNSLNISSSLIKAVLVNSASNIKTFDCESHPDLKGGFGSIHLANSLILDEKSPYFGLRIVDNVSIESKNDIYTVIKIKDSIKSKHPLKVTLTWLDPPLDPRSNSPLFADLDLYIVVPNKTIIYGNNNQYEESHSSVERIFIPNPIDGDYEIHVRCPKLPINDESIKFSLVINGPFDHHNLTANEKILTFKKTKNCYPVCGTSCNSPGKCSCKAGFTGTHCQIPVQTLQAGKSKFKMASRSSLYLMLQTWKPKHHKFIKIDFTPKGSLFADITIGNGQIPKFGGKFINFMRIKSTTSMVIDFDDEHNTLNISDTIYFEIFEASMRSPEIMITVSEEYQQTPKKRKNNQNTNTKHLNGIDSKVFNLFPKFILVLILVLVLIIIIFSSKKLFQCIERRRQYTLLHNEENIPFLKVQTNQLL